jgi:hypothetical protein
MKFYNMILALFISLTFIQPIYAAKAHRKIAQESKVLVEDTVHKVIPDGADFKIIFQRHAGIYYLKARSSNFNAIKSALEESSKTGDVIQLKADSTTLVLEELVLTSK